LLELQLIRTLGKNNNQAVTLVMLIPSNGWKTSVSSEEELEEAFGISGSGREPR